VNQPTAKSKTTKTFTKKQAVTIWLVSSLWGAAVALLATQQGALVQFIAAHQL
jgi:hypothetical protein